MGQLKPELGGHNMKSETDSSEGCLPLSRRPAPRARRHIPTTPVQRLPHTNGRAAHPTVREPHGGSLTVRDRQCEDRTAERNPWES
eukprot:scaffold269_cov404-Prasinococcus_capsulatus_cf.AAC.42